MNGLKIFLFVLLAALAGCSTDTGHDEEPQTVLDPATNPAVILGRWDEVAGDEWFIFAANGQSSTGTFTHFDGQTESGDFMFTTADNTIHCRVAGNDPFRIGVTFNQTDMNLATFQMGSRSINVKRTQQ